MAYTSVIPVRRLDRTVDYVQNKAKTTPKSLEEAVDYAANRDKTESACFETGLGCTTTSAFEDMRLNTLRWHKETGVQGYHLVQSFAEGEITPELAHQIGVEFAEQLLLGKYQAIVTTHLNTKHLWMLAFTLLARGTSGALLPEVQLSTPAPNTITQSLTATGTIQWAAGSLFYLPEGLLVEAVFVSEGEAVQEGDKIAALRREDVEQKLRSLQAELAQKQTEYARLTKPVAADSYDLEKAQQALQAAYQAAENSAAAWAEKEANAGS